MTEASDLRPVATAPSRTILYGVAGLTVISLGGAVISVAGDLNRTLLEALGPNGHLSVPLPMTAFQVATALAAGSRRRNVALVGSGLLGAALLVALVSGFFDGGYADERLDAQQRAYQMVLVGALGVVGAQAIVRFVRVWRSSDDG